MKRQAVALTILLLASTLPALAQRVEVKALGSYEYDAKQAEGKKFATAKPTEEEKSKALAAARLSAWKIYVSGMNPSRQQAVFKHERALLERLDEFVTDYVVTDAVKDPESRSLKVAARFAFNDERVAQALQALSVSPESVAAGGGSAFSFLFVSRKASTITQFDARKTEVAQSETATVKAADGGATSVQSSTRGGSTLQKEDVVQYEVSSSQDLDAAIGENLSTSGIEFVGYDDIVANCSAVPAQKFRGEFASSDEMSPDTRRMVIKAAKDCEIRYFAFGTVDTGVASLDPVTGNKRVYVSVRSQLWDISQKLPRRISSVGPKQYAGLGPDQSVASRNALNAAARDVSKTLVDQLNAKGIR